MTRFLLEGLGELAVLPRVLIASAAFFLLARGAPAGDWPQIQGPTRNGHAAADERLPDKWPPAGPKTLWQHPVGDGYAGVAVADGRVIVFHRQENEQIVDCLDAATGKPLWQHRAPTTYVSSIDRDEGPRATPVIHGDGVYLHGAQGDIRRLTLAAGKQLWSRKLAAEHGTPEGYFGAGSTPLVEGDKLLVNVGGRRGAGLVALRLEDGKTSWQATDEGASYSSPIVATIDGVRHAIFVTRLNTVSVDPATGAVRFRFPFGKRGPTVNAATPLLCDDRLFVTASYGVGAVMAAISENEAKPIWQGPDIMSSQYASPVYVDGALYGCHGRSDQPPVHLKAVDAKTGRVLWTEEGFGAAHLILAGDQALALKEDGTLVLWKPQASGFRSLASAKVLDGTTRALPALAAGRLYVRDGTTLKCLSVGEVIAP